jgi:branched-chain amino acid transport system substrate-binding protein
MMRHKLNRARLVPAVVSILAVAGSLTGCAVGGDNGAQGSQGSQGGGEPVVVGLVTSKTGPLAALGASYINGFEAGLDYITHGTNKIDGHPIDVQIANDNGDPATGTAAAKDLMGKGAKFLTGPISSAVSLTVSDVAVQNGGTYINGGSGTSELLAKNNNIFMSGALSPVYARSVVALAQVSHAKVAAYFGMDYQLGQNQAAELKKYAEPAGLTAQSVLLPTKTADFTPGVLQLKNLHPDLVQVAWPGDGTAQLYQALSDQGVYDSHTQVVTLASFRSQIGNFLSAAGPAGPHTLVQMQYWEGIGAGNDQEKAMLAYAKKTGVTVDADHPQGFNAALMVAHAVQETGGKADQNGVRKALEGWAFDSPFGKISIRPEDHNVNLPIYILTFSKNGSEIVAHVVQTLEGDQIAPPVGKRLN